MIVCLDTHVLIWGLRQEASRSQQGMIACATKFLEDLEKHNVGVIIPSVVVSELLVKIPPEEHAIFLQSCMQKFMVVPFDAIAAKVFAEIWNSKNNSEHHDICPLCGSTCTRNELKFDYQIVAIAVSHKAKCIYSHDEKLKKFAEGFIEVKKIPEVSIQLPVSPYILKS